VRLDENALPKLEFLDRTQPIFVRLPETSVSPLFDLPPPRRTGPIGPPSRLPLQLASRNELRVSVSQDRPLPDAKLGVDPRQLNADDVCAAVVRRALCHGAK
jgi:hypothetical protein